MSVLQAIQPIQFHQVADLYDYYVRADFDIDFFLREAKQSGGKILELTCGTGRVSIPLLRAGIDLTCVDYSEAMLEVFRNKLRANGLACKAITMDITALSLQDRFDFIFIPFHSLSEIVDRSKHGKTLRAIHNHLNADGHFICTLQNPIVRTRTIDNTLKSIGKFPMDTDGILEVKVKLSYDASTQIVSGCQLYEVYDQNSALVGTRQLDVNFYLFTDSEFEELAHSSGFRVDALYGDYNHSSFVEETSPFMIWKLKKDK